MRSLILLSALAITIVSCNKGEQAGSVGSGAGFEKQEERNGQSPGFEKEEYRMDDANITTPIDNRPDLEEED